MRLSAFLLDQRPHHTVRPTAINLQTKLPCQVMLLVNVKGCQVFKLHDIRCSFALAAKDWIANKLLKVVSLW